jgi:hypothetical protein
MAQAQITATDDELREVYNKLRDPNRDHSTPQADAPVKYNPEDFKVAAGYAVRVAQASTFEQYKEFMLTGLSPVPVKMSPAEMELLMGGKATEWIKAVGWVAGSVASAACNEV